MSHYIHHVAGRLRVKSPVLKGAEIRARRINEFLKSTPGVLSTDANIVTGSVVIRYAPCTIKPETLLQILREHGVVCDSVMRGQNFSAAGISRGGNPITDAIVEKLVGAVIERSAVALIGALI